MTARLLDAAVALRRRLVRRPSPRTQAVTLAVALVVFVGGGVVAWQRLGIGLGDLSPAPLLVLVLVLVPLTILANAAELAVSGHIVGVRFGWLTLIRTVVVATAANFLPIPGAALVRVHAIHTAGARLLPATSVTVVTGLVWVSAGSLVAGTVLLTVAQPLAGAIFLAVGVVLAAAALAGLVRLPDRQLSLGRSILELLLVEGVLLLLSALRMLAVLLAVGIAASLTQTLVLTVSGALAATAGVFPGGLGLTEAISAALAPLVALTAAAGFTATALNRLAGIVVSAPLAGALGADSLRRAARFQRELPADEPSDEPSDEPPFHGPSDQSSV